MSNKRNHVLNLISETHVCTRQQQGTFLCLTAHLENLGDLRIFLQDRQLLLDPDAIISRLEPLPLVARRGWGDHLRRGHGFLCQDSAETFYEIPITPPIFLTVCLNTPTASSSNRILCLPFWQNFPPLTAGHPRSKTLFLFRL